MSIKRNNRGSVLVAVLWCLVLLSVLVLGLLHATRTDLRLVKNYGDRIQAHYLALAGLERAKAVVYHDCVTRRQTATSHTGSVYDDNQSFRNIEFGRGHFSVLRPADGDESGPVFGVSDEESRLDVNTAATNELTRISGLKANIAAAIVDWRSGTNAQVAGGAGPDYYASLQPPYESRNAPFQTIRELLMVKGVTQEDLLGDDSDRATEPEALSSELGGFFDAGWASDFTVQSTDKNAAADGKDRVNIQTGDQAALTGVQGVTPEMARAIIAYRGQHQFQTIGDLLDVPLPQQGGGDINNNGANPNGPRAFTQELFEQTADSFTTDNATDQSGLININTAPQSVLRCLPGIDDNLARAIISRRQSTGYFANIAYLLEIPDLTQDIFKQVAPLVTARSETFRIISEGRVGSDGARQRIEAILHISPHDMRLLSYREDL
jgi:DNA uptake protein ComE-like DNA-binding protein